VDEGVTILGVDVGTTAMKMGVYRVSGKRGPEEVNLAGESSQAYAINCYNDGLYADIDPDKWTLAFRAGCKALSDWIPEVDAVVLSGTTPGLTAMDAEGNALYPAMLMLDQRSRAQAQQIITTVGLQKLLDSTGNMPVAGGCSLASILWLKDNCREAWKKTVCFGHSNTFMGKWLCGAFAIDPSSASLTALYNTVANDLTWNKDIAKAFGLSVDRLPRLMWAFQSPGRVTAERARDLGFRKEPPVVIGGNDAVLAAYSAGVMEPGQVMNVNGTCEIMLVCLSRCISSTRYNVRAHVIPERWLTLYVMNAGGKAYEWFKNTFCHEMSDEQFYKEFLPRSIDQWLERPSTVSYVPYLMGSRYSLEPLRAQFAGLTQESTREELLAAMVRGLCEYQREHIKDMALVVPLRDTFYVTGGANVPAVVRAKGRWMHGCHYTYREQSSLRGAALLGHKLLREGANS
jgi:sugar (pentulose or hexulose) kinase